jgi:chaperonin GroES
MQIKPLNDWAVIVPSEAAERSAGGLYIPDAAKEKPAEGVVEAIGPGALEEEGYGKKKKEKKDRKFIATTVKPGERVLYERYAGTKIEVGGIERVLVRERSILGIFVGNPGIGAKPLLLPSKTTAAETSLAKIAMTAITANVPAQPMKKAAGKAPAAATGKKKAAVKPAKKAAKKKAAAKPKKAAKKTASKKTKKKR